jgi:uncharacterized protein YdhG (YjbR/CyaY superfamily)
MLKPKTVDEYLNELPDIVRKTLTQVRKAVISAAPKAEEVISYRIPLYKYNGHLVGFMAFSKHCSFVTMSYSVINAFKNELKPYDVSGTTIHFPLDKPLPSALVKKLVKARIKENSVKKISKV